VLPSGLSTQALISLKWLHPAIFAIMAARPQEPPP
jgi:hypothetical protein